MTPQMARRRRSRSDLFGRVLALFGAAGMALFAYHALVLGLGRPSYVAFLFGLLFVVMSLFALRLAAGDQA